MKISSVILIILTMIILANFSDSNGWDITAYLILTSPYLYLLVLVSMAATKRVAGIILIISSVCAAISLFSLRTAFLSPSPQTGVFVLMSVMLQLFLVIVSTIPLFLGKGNFKLLKPNNKPR